MGNNSTKTWRKVLIIAPPSLSEANEILEYLALRANKNELVQVFSFVEFKEKETIIIKPSDTNVLS